MRTSSDTSGYKIFALVKDVDLCPRRATPDGPSGDRCAQARTCYRRGMHETNRGPRTTKPTAKPAHDRALAGRAIRTGRERAGLSQTELGGRCDPRTAQNAISALERSGASRRALVMVGAALGVTAEQLLHDQRALDAQASGEDTADTTAGTPSTTGLDLRELIHRHRGVIAKVAAELGITRQGAAAQIARQGLAGELEQARAGGAQHE